MRLRSGETGVTVSDVRGELDNVVMWGRALGQESAQMGSDLSSALELYLCDLGEEISSLWTSVSPFENRKIGLRCSLRTLQL